MRFKYILNNESESSTLYFFGQMDETTELPDCEMLNKPNLNLNFENLKAINSYGIRCLMIWFPTLNKSHLILQNCPKCLIDQFNMVSGLLPKSAGIDSFYVPFYCEETEEELLVLYRYGVNFFKNKSGKVEILHPQVLSKSNMEMSLDVGIRYFNFLSYLTLNRD